MATYLFEVISDAEAAAFDAAAGSQAADVIRDWSASDTLVFANGGVLGAHYVGTSASDFSAAFAAAKTAVGNGSANFVAVAVGADVFLFVDSRNDNFEPDDAVRLAGRTLDDISLSQLVATAAPPRSPVPPSPPPTPPPAPGTLGGFGMIAGNMDTVRLTPLIGADIEYAAATALQVGDDAYGLVLQGSNFTYDGNDQLVGGTINRVGLSLGPTFSASLDFGVGFSAAPLLGWLINDQAQAAFATVLARSDDIHGSYGPDLLRTHLGDDTLMGWGGADSLFGGAGNDFIYGLIHPSFSTGAPGGATYLRGEDGDDYILGGPQFDDLHGNMGNDTGDGGAGDDWVVGGKDNDLLYGGTGADIVYGNLGDDTCRGGEGHDTIRGGQATDLVLGEGGNDWLSGDRGEDTVTGGAGADLFHTFGDAGLDRVTDFSAAEGDRVLLAAGTQYTLAQVGGDTVITMVGGGQMVLVGVQLSSLPNGWIFGA